MIVWHRIIDYIASISIAFKAKQNPVKQNKYYKYQLLDQKKNMIDWQQTKKCPKYI